MEKFKYAPGKPGFGSKGSDGSAGQQGLSMYFTNYDPINSAPLINAAIANNTSLWIASVALPDGRAYNTGDLFVDKTGRIYEINAETDTFKDTLATLNISGYFTSAEVSSSDGFQRYYNTNITPKYIIDNVYSDSAIAYYEVPYDIYGIMPLEFTRIEYSNVALGNYNPFTVYSSGIPEDADPNAEAIAIVRDWNTNTFRIGNLDTDSNLRNVNLAFDVASLRQEKQASNVFRLNTPVGEVLTNYEINANALFDGVFTSSPVSFNAGYSSTDISIYWNLFDFTPDADVTADLYVYKDVVTNGVTFNLTTDASQFWPYIFRDIEKVGGINLTGIDENTYFKYYINFYKNGWERRSILKSVATLPTPNIWVNPSINYDPSWSHYATFCVSSNVEWTATYGSNPDLFMYDISTDYTYGISDSSLWIGLTENTDCQPRTGTILVSSIIGGGNSPFLVTINQSGPCIPVYLDVSGGGQTSLPGDGTYVIYQNKVCQLNFTDYPIGTLVDVKVNYTFTLSNLNSNNDHAYYDNVYLQITSPGIATVTSPYLSGTVAAGVGNEYTYSSSLTMSGIGIINVANLYVNLREHAFLSTTPAHFNLHALLEITSVELIWKSGPLIYPSYTYNSVNLDATKSIY
jgi:hypothetical protein